ncbi:MAG: acyl-CoA dehydrogenase family protein [Candidatus Sumerlaeia bacterium]|nr:acyl-CoA dehydrogenase family protein [Candidatus Sumerlaeia bacterium]
MTAPELETSSAEERTLRESVREFALEEILPRVRELEHAKRLPPELFRKLGEMGLLAMIYPEAYGGAGMDYRLMAASIEELARVCPGAALSVAATNSLAAGQIFLFGTEEQRLRWMPGIASGAKTASWGLTEPDAGSDSFRLASRAERAPGGWILNGRKSLITHASFCDLAVVMAMTDAGSGRDGITAFVVERGMKGFESGKTEEKLGMCASDTGDLVFRDCFVPDANVVGAPGMGGRHALGVLDGGRIGIAALAVGLAQGAMDASIAYAHQREQFGRPIAQFQAIQFKIADMATKIHAARLMVERAAAVKESTGKSGHDGSMAKLFASEISVQVAEEAIQIHGGYGYTKDFLVEKYWRDSKLLTIGEGTSEVQRLIIAKHMLA